MKISAAHFDGKDIRRVYDEASETWWFSVVDVVQVLTDSSSARRYWSDLKRKLAQEAGSNQLYEKIVQLKQTVQKQLRCFAWCSPSPAPRQNPSSSGSPK